MSGPHGGRSFERFCNLTPSNKTDLRVERCIEIARECLTDDPFRQVPELYREAWRLFEDEEPGPIERALRRNRHAFAVAEVALGTAKSALIQRDLLGDC